MKFTLAALGLLALSLYSVHAGPFAPMASGPGESSDPNAGFYVAGYGGANFSTDYGNRHTSFSGFGGSADVTPGSIHSGYGAVGGIKGGYTFPAFFRSQYLTLQPAAEIEALYLGTNSDDSLAGGINNHTHYNSAAGFVNGIIQFHLNPFDARFIPYLGVGVGGQYLNAHTTLNGPGGQVGFNSDDVVFAAQGLAGLRFEILPHIDLFSEYKFITAFDPDLISGNIGGTGISYRFRPNTVEQQVITAGVIYSF